MSSSPLTNPVTAARTDTGDQVRRLELLWWRLVAQLGRLTRWEFWPTWALYLPVAPWVAWLALRHGGPGVAACVNPSPELGLGLGMIVNESKWEILRLLPGGVTVPTALVGVGNVEDRLVSLRGAMESGGWAWPVVLKPDVGERGNAVRVIRDEAAARRYLDEITGPVVAQVYHPGPLEAGVFYMRRPGAARGVIFSITDKRLPVVEGDGVSTLRSLIWRHPRYRLQSAVFLGRLGAGAERVPAAGERVGLGVLGNHCRGAMFLDGKGLITEALTRAFDRVADQTPGLCFGRFDVRYGDAAEFAAGRGFAILELNGLLSESTNIYDPGTSFWRAQAVLRAQWREAFAIGRMNVERGAKAPAAREVARLVRGYFRRADREPSN